MKLRTVPPSWAVDQRLTVAVSGYLAEERFLRFVRRCVDEFRTETGDDDRCHVQVTALGHGAGRLHVVCLALGQRSDPLRVRATNLDAFKAIREAFFVARRWAEDRTPVHRSRGIRAQSLV